MKPSQQQQKHRRTQSSMDLKGTIAQQPPCKSICQKETDRLNQPTHQEESSASKQVIIERLDDDTNLMYQKASMGLHFGIKKAEPGNHKGPLFQIPEQNDLFASTQKSEEGTGRKKQHHHELSHQQQSSLFDQLKQVTINQKQTSFARELQKQDFQKTITPERGQKPKQTQQRGKDKSPLSSLLKSNKENVNSSNQAKGVTAFSQKQTLETRNSKDIEQKLRSIEQELKHLSDRQTDTEHTNQALQKQILALIEDGKRQREISQASFLKIEQIEQLSRKNEETIGFLKQHFLKIYATKQPDNISKRYSTAQVPDFAK